MSKKTLRIGILLDSYDVHAWTHKMLENIIQSDYAEVALVLLNDNEKEGQNVSLIQKVIRNPGRIPGWLVRKTLDALYEKLIARHIEIVNAEEIKNCRELLKYVDRIKLKTHRKTRSDYFKKKDVERVEQYSLDIMVRCGFGILRGDILKAARYGIWSYHHGDNRVNRGGPAGYWESMEGWPETGSILQILTEDLDNGKVLYRSFSCTDTTSVNDNKSNYYWKSLSFISRKMCELHTIGDTAFFNKVDQQNKHPVFYSERLYTEPTNVELAVLMLRNIRKKISLMYSNRFILDQWILMFHLQEEFSSSLWRYTRIIPPMDRFWADPYIIHRDDKYYIFIEECLYATDKGHISLITMDSDGNYSAPEVILEKPYHLSYPNVFEDNDRYYMIPESMENHTIELYECTEFPAKWEFKMNLMENIDAVDATLLYHNDKWWMFANVVEREGVSSFDELYLYFADNLLTTDWTPHPLNPVISDCKRARPAGQIFTEEGRIYRPSQNCSSRYGYGFNLSVITRLNETEYCEEVVSKVEPNWDKNIVGTHTFNRVGKLHVVDAILRRKKFKYDY